MNEREQTFLARLSEAIESEPLTAESALDAGQWDSIVVLSVIALIDEIFDVTVPLSDLQAVDSVPRLLELIRKSA